MTKLTCPKCGREYTPAEIFYPTEFFGNPKTVLRDEIGKIESITGTDMNTTEYYECDMCGCEIKVEAEIQFKVYKVKQFNPTFTDYIKVSKE